MKIICIGRNYADHAKEMKSELPTEPVFFMKPDTALLKPGQDFFYPDFTSDLHHELEIVVRICKVGKHIETQFASRYYDQVTLGIDFTARDLQAACKQKGLPWEKAKAFDNSAPIGEWKAISHFDQSQTSLRLEKNGETVQQGSISDMIFTVDEIISYISKFITLKVGDLIFTGTPAGVGPVKQGDVLKGYLNDEELIQLAIK